MINNRQNGRRRGRNGNGQRGGNPGNPGGGSRIDNRARGNANQLYEKYKSLARDAQMSGDRVNTEYYLQFADHYFRVLSENRGRFEEQGQRRIAPVNSFDDPDGDDEYGDEGEPIRADEQGMAAGRDQGRGEFQANGARHDGQRDGGQRDAGQRDGGQRENRFRDGGPREGGQRDMGQRDEARSFGNGRMAADEPRATGDERDDRFAMTGSPVANDPGEDSPDGAEPTPITQRRRGRPRRDAAPAPLAANDAPAAIEADRLPPSLALANVPVADLPDGDATEAPRPRRRRPRATGEASQAG